jgi:hypothetical protein
MEIQFYDVKARQKVGVPAERVRKVTFERQNKDGSTTTRYGFRAEHEGRNLTKFASKADWDALDAAIE